MTMPNEELRALKRSHSFLSSLLSATWSWRYFARLATSSKMRDRLRGEVYGCLRHYPFEYILDEMWKERIENELK